MEKIKTRQTKIQKVVREKMGRGYDRMIKDPLRKRYHRHYHPDLPYGRHHLYVDVFLILLTLVLFFTAAVSFFIWNRSLWDQGVLMDVLVSPTSDSGQTEWDETGEINRRPETIATDSELGVYFNYENRTDYPVKNVRLVLDFPKETRWIRALPLDWNQDKKELWVGDMAPKVKGSAALYYEVRVPLGQFVSLGAILSYDVVDPRNRDLILHHSEKRWQKRFYVNESSLKVNAKDVFPHVMAVGETYRNTLVLTRLESGLAEGPVRVCFKADESVEIWGDRFTDGCVLLDRSERKKSESFTFKSRAGEAGDHAVRLEVYRVGQDKNEFLILDSLLFMPVKEALRAVAYKINGRVPSFVEPEEDLNFSIQFFDLPVSKGRIVTSLDQNLFKEKTLKVLEGELDEYWNVPFEDKPEDYTIHFKGKVRSDFYEYKNYLRIQSAFYYEEPLGDDADSYEKKYWAFPPIEVPVFVRPEVDLALYYYTEGGDQIGRGPYPLRQGETSTLWLSAIVSTPRVCWQSMELEASLPFYVEWDSSSSESEEAGWSFESIGRILRFTDFRGATGPLEVKTKLKITPPLGSQGTSLPVLENVVLYLVDKNFKFSVKEEREDLVSWVE